jgi:hypothetical protein
MVGKFKKGLFRVYFSRRSSTRFPQRAARVSWRQLPHVHQCSACSPLGVDQVERFGSNSRDIENFLSECRHFCGEKKRFSLTSKLPLSSPREYFLYLFSQHREKLCFEITECGARIIPILHFIALQISSQTSASPTPAVLVSSHLHQTSVSILFLQTPNSGGLLYSQFLLFPRVHKIQNVFPSFA